MSKPDSGFRSTSRGRSNHSRRWPPGRRANNPDENTRGARIMIALWTSVITVSATLLGSILTFHMQRSITDRAAARRLTERVHQERLDVYSRFTGAAIHYRLSELTRWHRQSLAPDSVEARIAVDAAHSCRAAVFEVLSRLHILTDDPRLRTIATEVVEHIDLIHQAGNAEERRLRGIEAGEKIEDFVRFAAADVSSGTRAGMLLPFRR
ncbi:hypothetical protein [Nocardia sp. NPDC057668]|uniref:hypothetical protein n=1 Tax=Nocardia sp. NPDC057668 TaxID=3346202 RepID=UPI003671FE03